MADAQAAQGGTPNDNNGGGTPQNQELTFDGWFAGQDDVVKGLLDAHTSGLKNALQAERKQRDDLAKALKDATKELEAGTEARTKLEGITAKLDELEAQNAVYEILTAAGVTNLKLGWMAVQSSGALDKRGNVNLETIKAEFPELFNKKHKLPPGNAGDGLNNSLPAAQAGMNAFIRTASGRQQ